MKVAILTYSFGTPDGWGRTSYEFTRALLKNKVDCLVLTNFRAKNTELIGAKVVPCLTSYHNRWKKFILILVDYFRAFKYLKDSDIILSLIEPYSPLAWLYSIFNHKPYFIIAHGTFTIDPFKIWYLNWLYRLTFKKAKIIYCVAEFTKQALLKILPLNNAIVRLNAISTDKFRQPVTPLQKEGKKIILSVGVIKHRKGYHISIPAIARVLKEMPNIKYYIVGQKSDDNYYYQLQNLIKKYQLEKVVEFVIDADDQRLTQLYQGCEVFLLTPVNQDSHFEGFGMVFVEAGACGKPVIGTRGCGAQEAVIDNYNGLLVDQNDIETTAEAVIKLLKFPSQARKFGEQGRQKAKEFSYDYQIKKYLEDFKKVTIT